VLIAVLLMLKAGLSLKWDGQLNVTLRIAGLKFNLTGRMKRKKKPRRRKSKAPEQRRQEHKKPVVSGISDVIALVREVVVRVEKNFFRYIKVDSYDFDITVATDDAAKTAILYGAVSSSVFSLAQELYSKKARRKDPKRFSVRVVPDFSAAESTAVISITASLRIWQALVCLLSGGRGFMSYYSKKDNTENNDKEKENDNG
ncbi:MAG TPA: DUF2953 domain-containing protein, partial [Bacillota bacterium]|nr:DUF2953 domain-containing protein [Bacillota bacterium]